MTLDEKFGTETKEGELPAVQHQSTNKGVVTALRHAGYFGISFAAGAVAEMVVGVSEHSLVYTGIGGFLGVWNGLSECSAQRKLKGDSSFLQNFGYVMSTTPANMGGFVAGVYAVKGIKNLM